MPSTPRGSEGGRPVSLSDEEGVKEIVRTTVLDLWKVVNNLTRLRPSKRERYRVAIFGSARAQPGTFVYDEVKRACRGLRLFRLRHRDRRRTRPDAGGQRGRPCQRRASGRSAFASSCRSSRTRIRSSQEAFEHETFFTRLHHFVIASDAFVVVPGGIGTVLETLMVWQLLQVRHVENVPLILVGQMWKGLVDWAGTSMLDPRLALANPQDLQIPQCVDTADEAIALLRDLQKQWQSRP